MGIWAWHMPLCEALYAEAINLQIRMSRIYRDISAWQIKGMIEAGRLKRSVEGWRLDGNLL